MLQSTSQPPDLVYEGHRFVGVKVEGDHIKFTPMAFSNELAALGTIAFDDSDSSYISGRIAYPTRAEINGQVQPAFQSAHITVNTDHGLTQHSGLIQLYSNCSKGQLTATARWSEIERIDILTSRECQPPDIYLQDAVRSDDARILAVILKDGRVMPLCYSSEIDAQYIGSAAYLEAFRGALFAAIEKIAQRTVAERRKMAAIGVDVERNAAEISRANATRLGEPFVYRWVDKEPTPITWRQKSDQRGCVGGLILIAIIGLVGLLVAGPFGFIAAIVFLGGFGIAFGGLFAAGTRTDNEPVPEDVVREAYIAHAGGAFYFALDADGRPVIWQPWERVLHFEVADWWPMFGDAGASPYKTGWHAIVMDPLDAKPWCVASTIEAMAVVRERRGILETKFGASARDDFMRKLEGQKRSARAEVPAAATQPTSVATGGVPKRL